MQLFTHATMMFGNECLGELLYEATTAAIVMAGLFISFLIEFLVHRAMRWQASKKAETDSVSLSPKAVEKAEMANISIMEAGIIFHSLRESPPLFWWLGQLTNGCSYRYHSRRGWRLILHHALNRNHLSSTLRGYRLGNSHRFTRLRRHAPHSRPLTLTLPHTLRRTNRNIYRTTLEEARPSLWLRHHHTHRHGNWYWCSQCVQRQRSFYSHRYRYAGCVLGWYSCLGWVGRDVGSGLDAWW